MTFAPAPLIALGKYLVSKGCVNLGVVGDSAHVGTGVSYHLGKSQLTATAYSRQLPRDKAGLSEAASAIDIGKVGGGYPGLRALSSWLASQCQRRAIDTLDIREVIYSPDGVHVMRWDEPSQTVYPGGTGTGQGDDSHLTHTHVSFYRDSETRDKLAVFRRYFEEAEVKIEFKVERWTLDGGGKVTTFGAPYKADGTTVDYSQRLAYLSDAGGANARLDFLARSRLTLPDASQDAAFKTALAAYALPAAPLPDCSAAVQAEYQRMKTGTTATATIAFPEPPV